jgi:hypothetical protein
MNKLSQTTIERLKYYVYLLINPINNQIFYVGKGHGNRINQHLFGANVTELDEIRKIQIIHEIESSGLQVKHSILRHGLTEKEAFEIESSVIDLIGIENLSNIVKGHNSTDRGLMSLEDIEIKYQAVSANFNEPALLININKRYFHDMPAADLYEATRKYWKIDRNRVSDIHIICAVYVGIIREVYNPVSWHEAPTDNPDGQGRSFFEGKIAPSDTREKYINKSVSRYWTQGSQNPIKYVDLKQ